MKLKTLKDIEITDWDELDTYEVWLKNKLRKDLAIKWIKAIEKKSEEHWEKLDKLGYGGWAEKEETCYIWKLEGIEVEDWHEASDPEAMVRILKHIFNLKEEDLK